MIRNYYPRATVLIDASLQKKTEMTHLWNGLLDSRVIQDRIVVLPDGSGSIIVQNNWSISNRDRLTEMFRECIEDLWEALDSLVIETVQMFSVQHRVRDPHLPRFFPIADSQESFDALLEESSLDGISQKHLQVISDCQPFREDSGIPEVDSLQRSLQQLVDWETSLTEGASIAPWITTNSPRIEVESPAVLCVTEIEASGPLEREKTVARFQVDGYYPGISVFGMSQSVADICLPHGFEPQNTDDIFENRLREAIAAVVKFAAIFTRLSSEIPGNRQVLLGARDENFREWDSTSEFPVRWSTSELAELQESNIGLARVVDSEELTFLVETPEGVYQRFIPNASPLRHHERPGLAAETAIQDAAATWGLPDFVMLPSIQKKGNSVREISDGLLLVGKLGAVIQAKAREIAPKDDQAESRWLDKQINKATKQVGGTVRSLRNVTGTRMINGRGREISFNGAEIDWVGVVVIEHPSPPDLYEIMDDQGNTPCIVLLRRDWEFLFEQLRSASAVVEYLHRVKSSTDFLGQEPERYFELAAADLEAGPGYLAPELLAIGQQLSAPMLPITPAGVDNQEAHGLVRILLEDIATSEIDESLQYERQLVLASIDRLPVAHRTELGTRLIEWLEEARNVDSGSILWRSRIFLSGGERDQLGFAICSQLDENSRAAFTAWALLRHHERGTRFGFENLMSVNILVTPRGDGFREWDTTMCAVREDPELTEEQLDQYRLLFGSSAT